MMVDLGRPDALIRTASLAALPRDLLKVPIARDVLTEELAFYYEQNEDRLGLSGAVKRIAYEHQLNWTDQILVSVFNEPAELAFWRDGKGALRHFALVIKRNTLAKVLQEAATVALKDGQLKIAGELDTNDGTVKMYALELNPRRTLLIVAQGERIVVLSDPGLMFDRGGKTVSSSSEAVAQWLQSDGVLSAQFALGDTKARAGGKSAGPVHTLAIGAPTLALGYGAFVPGFRGLRFDFQDSWSTAVWVESKLLPAGRIGERALWKAAPANPSACVVLPVDWHATQNILEQADKKPNLPPDASLALLGGPALTCWYGESALYSPVFIGRFGKEVKDRNAAVQALAAWAIAGADDAKAGALSKTKSGALVWRSAIPEGKEKAGGDRPQFTNPSVGVMGDYVVFSPDKALVDLVLDTLARKHPSVSDQMPATDDTVALLTPRRLSAMAEKEALDTLERGHNASMRDVAEKYLPARMRALAKYPPYRLDVASNGKVASGWQRVEWRTPGEGK
jgi:uncharacterized protein YfaA (DUF2138 family)